MKLPAGFASVALLPLLAACQALTPSAPCEWRYQLGLDPAPATTLVLCVTADLTPAARAVELPLSSSGNALLQITGDGAPLEEVAPGKFATPERRPFQRLEYRVQLTELARHASDRDTVRAARRSLVATWDAWLLRPENATTDTITLDVRDAPERRIVLGLPREGSSYRAGPHHLSEALHGVFGDFQHRVHRLPSSSEAAPNASVDVVVLDGSLQENEMFLDFMEEATDSVAAFYGGWPVTSALIVTLPEPRRNDVLFGRVLPSSAPTVFFWVGERVRPRELREDWVVVHELLHLGFPPVARDARWLDEGISTYLEPILRARMGWLSEVDLWAQFVDQMRRGRRAMEKRGLRDAHGIDDTYWGGAAFCFFYDLAARRATRGTRGLEHGLRQMIQEGRTAAGRRAGLDSLLQHLDRCTGTPVAQTLIRQHVDGATPVDWNTLWSRLGVHPQRDGSVELDDDAPDAWLRRAIVRGAVAAP